MFGKDGTRDILDGISSKVRYERDIANHENYDVYGRGEDWLRGIQRALTTALAFETEPTLGITCQGRFGEYIASKIVSYVGSNSDGIRLVAASEKQLKAILDQQALQLSDFYDERMAVETGKFIGAGYLLVCSPYCYAESVHGELHCKLASVQTAAFMGGGIIVSFPIKELPAPS